jgi:hypothetical protein
MDSVYFSLFLLPAGSFPCTIISLFLAFFFFSRLYISFRSLALKGFTTSLSQPVHIQSKESSSILSISYIGRSRHARSCHAMPRKPIELGLPTNSKDMHGYIPP